MSEVSSYSRCLQSSKPTEGMAAGEPWMDWNVRRPSCFF